MKAYVQNLKKASLTLQRAKHLDEELSATESHEFQGINGCLQWVTKEFLYPFQFVVKVLQRRQGQARMRDLLKANEVIDEIKQYEDFTLTFRVLDLTSCGLIGVSDASLGCVDRFGYPTDQDCKTVKVYSQAGVVIFIGEKPLVPRGARGKFNVLECDSRTITRVFRSSMAAETRGLGLQVDSMHFYGDLLNEVLGASAPFSKRVHLKQSALDWPKMIVTDARDVYDKLSTEKGGLQQQKALTLEIATIREWLVNSDAQIRWTADDNMIMNGGVKKALGSSTAKRRMECTTRRHSGSRKVSVSAKGYTKDEADSNASLFRRVARRVLHCGKSNHIVENESDRVVEQNIDAPMSQILEEIVEVEAIVDITVLQIELVFFWHGQLFCGVVAWSVPHGFVFEFTSLNSEVCRSN